MRLRWLALLAVLFVSAPARAEVATPPARAGTGSVVGWEPLLAAAALTMLGLVAVSRRERRGDDVG